MGSPWPATVTPLRSSGVRTPTTSTHARCWPATAKVAVLHALPTRTLTKACTIYLWGIPWGFHG